MLTTIFKIMYTAYSITYRWGHPRIDYLVKDGVPPILLDQSRNSVLVWSGFTFKLCINWLAHPLRKHRFHANRVSRSQ